MNKYIYRIVSEQTIKKFPTITFRHPYNWNLFSAYSWKKHGDEAMTTEFFGISCERPTGHFQVKDLTYPIVQNLGLYDSTEGMIFTPKGISKDGKKLVMDTDSFVSQKIVAHCFSYIECDESEIEKKIEEKIDKTKGYNHGLKNYMYRTIDEDFFAYMVQCIAKQINKRIGLALVHARYYSTKPILNKEKPFLYAMAGDAGAVFHSHMINSTDKFSENDIKDFHSAIERAIPLKYYPVYKDEEEVRLLIYVFDEWKYSEEGMKISLDASEYFSEKIGFIIK